MVMLGSVKCTMIVLVLALVSEHESTSSRAPTVSCSTFRILREDCTSQSDTFLGGIYAFADDKRKVYAKLMFFFSYASMLCKNQEALLTSCA